MTDSKDFADEEPKELGRFVSKYLVQKCKI
jgi:hypothetical protein